jgi:hypothetical protein
MASSLRRITTHGRATLMPVRAGARARRLNIHSRVRKRRFCLNRGGKAGEGRAARPFVGFGKERRARAAVGILRKARAPARPVRIEATRTRFCPSLLRRPDENVRARRAGARQRHARAEHHSYRSHEFFLLKPRARSALRRPVVKDLLRRSEEARAASSIVRRARGCGLRFAQRQARPTGGGR